MGGDNKEKQTFTFFNLFVCTLRMGAKSSKESGADSSCEYKADTPYIPLQNVTPDGMYYTFYEGSPDQRAYFVPREKGISRATDQQASQVLAGRKAYEKVYANTNSTLKTMYAKTNALLQQMDTIWDKSLSSTDTSRADPPACTAQMKELRCSPGAGGCILCDSSKKCSLSKGSGDLASLLSTPVPLSGAFVNNLSSKKFTILQNESLTPFLPDPDSVGSAVADYLKTMSDPPPMNTQSATSASVDEADGQHSHHLSAGDIAGIVVAAVAALVIAACVVAWRVSHRKKNTP